MKTISSLKWKFTSKLINLAQPTGDSDIIGSITMDPVTKKEFKVNQEK